MATPTLVKTWQYNVNNIMPVVASTALQGQQMLYGIKTALTGFASNPWIIAGSSDAAAGAMDAVDRITASNKLTWTNGGDSGAARSWFVVQNTILGNFQVLFSCQSNGYNPQELSLFIAVSPGGLFTGGSNTARPTATDEHILNVGASGNASGFWMSASAGLETVRQILHVQHASDGTATRIIIYRNSRVVTFFNITQLIDTPLSVNIVAYALTLPNLSGASDDNLKMSYNKLNDVSTWHHLYYGGVRYAASAFCTAEGWINAMAGEQLAVANEITGEWWMGPVTVASVTIPIRGRLGRWPDIYFTHTAGLVEGDTFPADASNQFLKVNHMVIPWDGSAPVIV